ncbi:proton-associated sugar transporter A-like [Sergentomyia squamirostris]
MNLYRIKWILQSLVLRMSLKPEEDHTKKIHHNYSHVFRKKSLWELVRLSSVMIGIELAYSAETAFVSPILLNIGLNHRYMTMVWSLSACCGLVCSPFIGPLTDQCRLLLGRRRPLIIALSVFLIIGLLLVPHGSEIGLWLERQISVSNGRQFSNWAIVFTVIGTVILDFSADNCQTPARAYLLDMCQSSDHTKALSIFSIMCGVGSFFGYAMSAYNWENLGLTAIFGDNISAVYAIVTILFVIFVTVTLTTFREIPLTLLENNDLPCPFQNTSRESQVMERERRKVSFVTYMKSIIRMPSSIKILCITGLLGWMSDVCYSCYFTDFVGEAVFRGDPSSESQSEEYALYESGIRFGCWGLSIYALSCIIYSMILDYLMKILRLKIILIGGPSLFGLSMICLATWPTKLNVLLLSISAGINFATFFTIPFVLLAQYHSQDSFKSDKNDGDMKSHRGLGTDIAIINSSLFLAQIIVSLTIGSLVSWIGSTSAVVYAAGVCSLCAAVVSTRILYLD